MRVTYRTPCIKVPLLAGRYKSLAGIFSDSKHWNFAVSSRFFGQFSSIVPNNVSNGLISRHIDLALEYGSHLSW